MIEIHVNGQPARFEEGFTVAALLDSLGRKPLGLAVEVNREVVPRSLHGETRLRTGDRVEIVHMVGGG
jgi:sulfur carrier protein